METLDIILLACFIPALVTGVLKGFVEQLVAIASLVGGTWLAFHFSGALATTLAPTFSGVQDNLLRVICFAIILVVAVLILHLLGRFITKLLKAATLGWFDRLLGLVFSIFKAALVLGLLITLFETLNAKWELVGTDVLNSSVVYCSIRNFAMKVFPFLKSLIANV